jgi:hypothetical protein
LPSGTIAPCQDYSFYNKQFLSHASGEGFRFWDTRFDGGCGGELILG